MVVDKFKDALCVYSVSDWAGNVTRDTVRYVAPVVSVKDAPIDEVEILNAVHVPASNTMTIEIGKMPSALAGSTSLLLYALDGQLVRNFTAKLPSHGVGDERLKLSVDVSGLSSGLYILVVQNPQSSHKMKVIVQH